ncbi:hypothetical protein EXIGLDRAFT_702415 [Exidia glandulosa HHB12029]|uniref:Protein kinase domain-containing protein n=1 Tax=Exidia glandulosa HHB12029 TaxID=1314781 RepID=A0A165CJD3_EXIGL|nr:hypothetical protein EXIGLDRAFT_702415 [Exidia glandulosa HHB12029]
MPDEHFLDVLTLSEDGRRALLERLLHWRATAQPSDLVGTTLELGTRFVSVDIVEGKKRAPRRDDFVQCRQPHCHHFDWPSLRPLPPSFTQSHTAVRIGKALQAGVDYHSQVYAASFDLDGNSTAGNEVVIKIYQPSLTPQMVPLQGGFVPHAYGFYHVILPNAEPAIAFIMEKIDAVPSDTIAERVHNRYGDDKNEALKAVWSGVLAAGHAIQTCNLMTTDERNYYKDVLWPRDSFTQPGPSFPVLIDFADITPKRFCEVISRTHGSITFTAIGFKLPSAGPVLAFARIVYAGKRHRQTRQHEAARLDRDHRDLTSGTSHQLKSQPIVQCRCGSTKHQHKSLKRRSKQCRWAIDEKRINEKL